MGRPFGGGERPVDGIQERGKVEGMDEGASDVLLREQAGESGEEMDGAREGGIGRAGSRAICATLGKDRGSDTAGGDGSTTVGDPETRKVGVAAIHGVREIRHGRPSLGFKG